jgi:UDP-N-acetylmuramate--alanine ligase
MNGALIFDDYAHHPTEIAATIEAAREKFPQKKIVLVYQQHQVSRAEKFFAQIATSLAAADLVIIPNFYIVREEKLTSTISPKNLVAEINAQKGKAIFTKNFAKTVDFLRKNLTAESVVIVAGAGDIFLVSEKLIDC